MTSPPTQSMARARLGIRTEESDEFSDVLKIIYKQKFCEENKDLLVFACTFLVDHVSSSNVQCNLFLVRFYILQG